MPKKLQYVTIPLRISSVIYGALALIFTWLMFFAPMNDGTADTLVIVFSSLLMILVSVGLVVFIELVIRALRRGAYWSWIAGICLTGVYLPSLFLPLGVFMLVGLLDDDTKEHCRKNKGDSEETATETTESQPASTKVASASVETE